MCHAQNTPREVHKNRNFFFDLQLQGFFNFFFCSESCYVYKIHAESCYTFFKKSCKTSFPKIIATFLMHIYAILCIFLNHICRNIKKNADDATDFAMDFSKVFKATFSIILQPFHVPTFKI